MEDAAVRVKRHDALLDARTSTVVHADHWRTDGLCEIHHLVALLGEPLTKRATEHGEVLGEHEHLAAVDRPPARDDTVGQRARVLDAEAMRAVPSEHVELD